MWCLSTGISFVDSTPFAPWAHFSPAAKVSAAASVLVCRKVDIGRQRVATSKWVDQKAPRSSRRQRWALAPGSRIQGPLSVRGRERFAQVRQRISRQAKRFGEAGNAQVQPERRASCRAALAALSRVAK
jgi:hypothetical protein